jgi:hypothetical protein
VHAVMNLQFHKKQGILRPVRRLSAPCIQITLSMINTDKYGRKVKNNCYHNIQFPVKIRTGYLDNASDMHYVYANSLWVFMKSSKSKTDRHYWNLHETQQTCIVLMWSCKWCSKYFWFQQPEVHKSHTTVNINYFLQWETSIMETRLPVL